MFQGNRNAMGWWSATTAALLVGAAPIATTTANAAAGNAPDTTAPAANGTDDAAIVVTATRREQALDKVPLKIDALNQAQLDVRGVRSIEDLVRYTPGVLFTQTGGVQGNSSTNISIRGITSDVGSATTAIYIDDTPIQIRNIGYFGGNPYPQVFDLDRVEVLKGPQGTLFGAGAEGGAVRFLTSAPNLSGISEYARGEVATTDHGAPSYEAGGAVSAPLVEDKIGLRVSASYRRDGGYIDRVNYNSGDLVQKDANWQRTYVLRAALAFKPVDELTITPSVFYQNQYQNARNQYWENLTTPGSTDYRVANTLPEPRSDHFVIPALRAEWSGDGVKVFSNTSYFSRNQQVALDYTNYLRALFTGDPFTDPGYLAPSAANVTTRQENFTQELRVQSQNGKVIDWTVGFYYSNQRQSQQNLTTSSTPGAPPGDYDYTDNVWSKDEQVAGFANVDLHATDRLNLTGGVRVSSMSFAFTDAAGGPVNGGPSFASGQTKETPVTPKFGISYQVDPLTLVYANAAKGFRQGGAQGPVPAAFCASDLSTLGIGQSPTTYKSDSVWSFDGGVKSRILGDRINLDANAYWIKWDNIQQAVVLPNCGFSFIDNLGKANSRGADLTIDIKVIKAVHIGANIGFNRTTFADNVYGGSGTLLAAQGDRIGGPQWTGTGYVQYGQAVAPGSNLYIRSDVTFRSTGPAMDPQTYSYDPGLPPTPASAVVSLRIGLVHGLFDISAFANNLTNTSQPLNRTHDAVGSPLYYDFGYRPRTIGLTLVYRK